MAESMSGNVAASLSEFQFSCGFFPWKRLRIPTPFCVCFSANHLHYCVLHRRSWREASGSGRCTSTALEVDADNNIWCIFSTYTLLINIIRPALKIWTFFCPRSVISFHTSHDTSGWLVTNEVLLFFFFKSIFNFCNIFNENVYNDTGVMINTSHL